MHVKRPTNAWKETYQRMQRALPTHAERRTNVAQDDEAGKALIGHIFFFLVRWQKTTRSAGRS
jgi:hypothetical protein